MIAQSVALCIIAVCAVLFGIGVLRFICAWHRLDAYQQDAEFRAQYLLAESAMQLRGKRSTRVSDGGQPLVGRPESPVPRFDDRPAKLLVATEVNLRG